MLYLANTLKIFYPKFHNYLIGILKENKIEFNIIPNTKDVWLRDFMPIKINNNFIWFTYNPIYLRPKKYHHLTTEKSAISFKKPYNITHSDLIIDGGNCLIFKKQAMLTDRIYKDNKFLSNKDINKKLIELLQLEKLIILPAVPNDFTGHIDGLVRWLDEKTILLSNPENEKEYYKSKLFSGLKKQQLNYVFIENKTNLNSDYISAKGCYTNYIELENEILFPVFNIKSDQKAMNQIQLLFPSKKLVPIYSNAIAKNGGLLHCISWQD